MDVMSDEAYKKFLRGKRVVVVSHADNLVGSRQGKFIDSYDFVIRLNEGIPVPEELKIDVGERCDILYSSLSPNFRVSCGEVQPFVDSGVKVVVRPVPLRFAKQKGVMGGCDVTKWRNTFVSRILDTDLKMRVVKDQPFLHHANEMKGNIPLTGVATVWDLVCFPVSEIMLMGFNFFMQKTYDQYPAHPKTPEEEEKWHWGTKWEDGHRHSILPQIKYLFKMMKKDPRIKVDNILARILAEHGAPVNHANFSQP